MDEKLIAQLDRIATALERIAGAGGLQAPAAIHAGNAGEAARSGILQLEEAILDILLEGMQQNRRIGVSEITRRTGLPGEDGDSRQDWAAWSFLQKLVGENRAAHPGHGRYELSQAELALRRGRRDGNSPETAARLGLRQVENAILDCLQEGLSPANITHRLRLPISASHFLGKPAAENGAAQIEHGRYEPAEPAAAGQDGIESGRN